MLSNCETDGGTDFLGPEFIYILENQKSTKISFFLSLHTSCMSLNSFAAKITCCRNNTQGSTLSLLELNAAVKQWNHLTASLIFSPSVSQVREALHLTEVEKIKVFDLLDTWPGYQ